MSNETLMRCVNAGVPVIQITCDDFVEVELVIEYSIEKKIHITKDVMSTITGNTLNALAMDLWDDSVGIILASESSEFEYANSHAPVTEAVKELISKGSNIVIVNLKSKLPFARHVGLVTAPSDCVYSLIDDIVQPHLKCVVGRMLEGLSFDDASTAVAMTLKETGGVSPKDLGRIINDILPEMQGLKKVEVYDSVYLPNARVHEYAETVKRTYRKGLPAGLRHRGIILEGSPGTGKTEAAKYIARVLDVPLYALDTSGLYSKYVGESEKNVRAALDRISKISECVIIIDEVEKLLAGREDSNTTSGFLAHLLWWLQERTDGAIVVMTTNDLQAVPTELYRPGRIDASIYLRGLSSDSVAEEFVQSVVVKYVNKYLQTYVDIDEVDAYVKTVVSAVMYNIDDYPVSQAYVVSIVKDAIRDRIGNS